MEILIADDHFLVRKGLRQLLEESLPVTRVEEAGDGQSALDSVKASHFDIVILDYSMPGRSGLDLIRDIKDADPGTNILVLTILPEEQYALRAFRLGASGCLNKSADPAELVESVRSVAAGHRYVSPRASELLLDDLSKGSALPHARLSDREYQIFILLAGGRSVGEIAELLSLSVKTVSTYRSRLLEKMNMENNAQLMNYAFRQGLASSGQ